MSSHVTLAIMKPLCLPLRLDRSPQQDVKEHFPVTLFPDPTPIPELYYASCSQPQIPGLEKSKLRDASLPQKLLHSRCQR